ncbi:MAG: nickel-dependent lactate racemase, partial [Gammaproteobacteria bacterium]|nr:nickel-dependent lactate racemase [Gammaproteobacteria bacterium]
MIVDLLYGKTGLPVTFDDDLDVTVVAKPRMPLVPDADVAVRKAFAVPVGCPPLAELARGKNSACILICDVTRPVPNGLFLRPLLATLLMAGIDASAVTILVATGLHRPNLGDELLELVGDAWVLDRVQVVNHYALDDAAHVDFGETRTLGTPVKLDGRFVEADLRIATGLVEPHFMAGYSGGRKVVAPGIAHADTIRTFHSARFIENPSAVQCQLEGNPLHEEQLEIVRMLGDVYALNTVIDDERRLSFVNFGEIVASHAEAVAYADRYLTVPVTRRFRTVVTSAAGYPLDQTYYQTVKGMVTPMDILDHDATLILASDCSEGLGSDAFRASQQRLIDLGSDAFLASLLQKRFADIDEWESEMQTRAQRVARVRMKSRLNDRDRELTGVELIDSVEEAVRESVALTGDGAIAVIPEGPYVVPRYRALGA